MAFMSISNLATYCKYLAVILFFSLGDLRIMKVLVKLPQFYGLYSHNLLVPSSAHLDLYLSAIDQDFGVEVRT